MSFGGSEIMCSDEGLAIKHESSGEKVKALMVDEMSQRRENVSRGLWKRYVRISGKHTSLESFQGFIIAVLTVRPEKVERHVVISIFQFDIVSGCKKIQGRSYALHPPHANV